MIGSALKMEHHLASWPPRHVTKICVSYDTWARSWHTQRRAVLLLFILNSAPWHHVPITLSSSFLLRRELHTPFPSTILVWEDRGSVAFDVLSFFLSHTKFKLRRRLPFFKPIHATQNRPTDHLRHCKHAKTHRLQHSLTTHWIQSSLLLVKRRHFSRLQSKPSRPSKRKSKATQTDLQRHLALELMTMYLCLHLYASFVQPCSFFSAATGFIHLSQQQSSDSVPEELAFPSHDAGPAVQNALIDF